MIKKLFIFLLAGFLITGAVQAQTDDSQKTVDIIVKNIMAAQNVSEISKINCTQISDDQLDELGDAYMELMHPGVQHEYMDQMMGGEGSTSLKLMHINMGRAYLGCDSTWPAGGMMMGSGMMGGGMMGSGMMGGYYPNYGAGFNSSVNTSEKGGVYSMMNFPFMGLGFAGGWIVMILFWILVIIGIVWLVKSLIKSNGQNSQPDAREILKIRYAKGEIDKEEFEAKKKDLAN